MGVRPLKRASLAGGGTRRRPFRRSPRRRGRAARRAGPQRPGWTINSVLPGGITDINSTSSAVWKRPVIWKPAKWSVVRHPCLERTRWKRRRSNPSASLVRRLRRGTPPRSALRGKSNGRRHQLRHRRRKRLLREQRVAADQHQVTADVEPGCLARQADRILEGIAVGHQGGRGQDAVAVRFHDAGVDVRREAEIVGVDYELFPLDQNGNQNSVSRMVRNFLGLARMSLASDWNSRVAPFSESYNAGLTSICPSVPCPALSLSMVPLNLAMSSSSRWCRASSLSSLPAVPLPALRSASSVRISASDALASSYSAGSLSSLPALPLPACKSARMASTRLMGERISWYSASS